MRYLARPPATADVVVIGGGVVGCATAFFTARAGLDTVLLERRPALATLTTAAATGAFRLQFDNREELELVRASVEMFLRFADLTGQTRYDPQVRQQGYLFATTDPQRAAWQREVVARQRSWGLDDVEILDGDAARRRFGYLAGDVLQARFRAADGFCDPKRIALGFAAGSGAGVACDCPVLGIETDGHGVAGVRTAAGTVATRTAVVAAGPFSAAVAGAAGVTLPLETVARHKVVLPDVAAVPPGAPMTIDDDTGAHWRPALGGAFLLHTDPATPATAPTDDVPADHRAAFRLLDPASPVAVARVAPFWREVWAEGAAGWVVQSGQYTVTPDHRPLVGETDVRGLWVNTGYSGHGVMGSPAGSRLLADQVTGRATAGPLAPARAFAHRPRDLL